MCGKNSQIYDVHIPIKCIKSRYSYLHFRFPLKSPGRIFENLLSPTAESSGENYDLLYQNSIRKFGDELEHLAVYIFHSL